LGVVLSIGKLAAGQARHYLDQAGDRVDRATSVASGVEDYYLAGVEAAEEWMGGGSLAIGLRGTVEDAPLHDVLAGKLPGTDLALRSTRGTRVPGFDLTFSAPKSASVLFGIGEDSVRRAIQEGHDAAVRDAMAYLERMAGFARRGHGGEELIAGKGLVAAAFRHRTSRAGDPQLHTHVLVANVIEGADGRWSALDGRRIYAHAKTASYLYEARLRAELTERLGVGWTPVRKGLAEIAGVPRPVLRAYSQRRAEIEAELARLGKTSAAAAQVAALATRKVKDRLVDPRRPKIVEPHSKPVQGSSGLRELRPGGGRTIVRPLYARVDERQFVILAIAPDAVVDSSGFKTAVKRAQTRAKHAYGLDL
jgi:conjugative relaxase-like TrwC/TraI family protein